MRFFEIFFVPLHAKACEISLKYVFIMATMTLPQTSQIIVTLEDNALVADTAQTLTLSGGGNEND